MANFSCKNDDADLNVSSLYSLPTNVPTPGVVQTLIDAQKKYLFITIRGSGGLDSEIHKVDLKTLKIVKTTILEKTIPFGYDNIYETSDNGFVASFFSYAPQSNLVVRFDSDLNIVQTDTITKDIYFGRVFFNKSTSGEIYAVESNKDTSGIPYLRYFQTNENYETLKEIKDTSSLYSPFFFVGIELLRTSDGGFLYSTLQLNPPYFTLEGLLEKRDADFNLQWRTIVPNFTGQAFIEHNGKYYLYGDNPEKPSPFILTYSQNGEFLEQTYLENNGFTSTTGENMVMNDQNEFMIVATTSENSSNGNFKGVLFIADENLNIKEHKVFGGNGGANNASIQKIDNDRYLILYTDGGFKTEGEKSRLVLRFIDSKGNFLN